METAVEVLIQKAASAETPEAAVMFSQAAASAASAMCALKAAQKND